MVLRRIAPIVEDGAPPEHVDVHDPEPGETDILIRVRACGVCVCGRSVRVIADDRKFASTGRLTGACRRRRLVSTLSRVLDRNRGSRRESRARYGQFITLTARPCGGDRELRRSP